MVVKHCLLSKETPMLKFLAFVAAFVVFSYAHAEILGDVDGNGQIDLTEAIYALQSIAGIRPPLSIAGHVEVMSGYLETVGTTEQPIIVVPADKKFVLTDVAVTFSSGWHKFFIIEESDGLQTTKLHVHYSGHGVNPLSFRSGISFAPGAHRKYRLHRKPRHR